MSRAATEYRYEKLTWPESEEAAALGKVCIVPCGSVEQHGPHLPLDVDIVCPQDPLTHPRTPRNALLHLFAFRQEQCRYGAGIYRPRSSETSSFLDQLVRQYLREGWAMPFTLEEFNREYKAQSLREMTPE